MYERRHLRNHKSKLRNPYLPKPTNGIFTIHTEGTNIKEIKVLTVLGEEILKPLNQVQGRQVQDDQSVTMDMSGFAKGIYFIQITTSAGSANEEEENRKIVVE